MNTPRVGSAANACTEVNTPERTRNVPSRLSENAAMASSSVQFSEGAAFFSYSLRVEQGCTDQPRHKRGIFDRVPEPPTAPAKFVIGPTSFPARYRRSGMPRQHASRAETTEPTRD